MSTELAFRGVYGWLLWKGAQASFDEALPTTVLVIDRTPDLGTKYPSLHVLETFKDGKVLVSVPRYQAFSDYVQALAEKGTNFIEIAGNRGPLVLTYLTASNDKRVPGTSHVLLRQPLTTEPERVRLVLQTTIAELPVLLRFYGELGYVPEHIFDY